MSRKKTSCRRNDWECICEYPRTKKQREQCASIGWVDSFAVTGPPPRRAPYEFQKRKGGMGQHRSQLFTWTSKVHAPSWSLPAVGTCPGVCGIEKKALRAPENIPKKCIGCYAFQAGQYRNPDVRKAVHRRYGWFDSTPAEDVVENLVEAIRISGREECRHKRATKNQPWICTTKKGRETCTREDPVMCTRDPRGVPVRFRLFDSGDFHDARAVRIRRKVIARFPRTKFWAPTTAWVRHGLDTEPGLMEELGKLAAMRNVALKPSSLLLDKPAVHVKFNEVKTLGATVLSWERIKGETQCSWVGKPTRKTCITSLVKLPAATTLSGRPVIYNPSDDATIPEKILIDKVEHYLCRGDCAKCQRCWDKSARVAYVQHGPDIRDGKKMLKRTNEMLDYMNVLYPQYKDLGPLGTSEHPATRFLSHPMFLKSYKKSMKTRAATRARKAAEKEAMRAVAGLDTRRWRKWA